MGFGKKGKNSFTIHRSEEVLPGEMRGALSRGSSASSDGEGSADGDRFAFAKVFYFLFKFLENILIFDIFMYLVCELSYHSVRLIHHVYFMDHSTIIQVKVYV